MRAVLALALPLLPSLSAGDVFGLSVFAAMGAVSLWLLHAGGLVRLRQWIAMAAIGSLALGFLLGLASAVRS